MPEFKCRWYFGDGEESTERTPVHIYKMAGEYEVLLIKEFESGATLRNTFIVYVYEWMVGDRLHVVYSNRTLRDAVVPMQGIGITEWGGKDWLWPEAYVGTCNGYAKNNEVISIILDTFSGKHYRIGVREQWLDKLDNLGYVRGIGSEITCRWKHKEYVSLKGESEDVRHVETHAAFRPYEEEDRSKDGHNPDTGYRENFAVTARIYRDGNIEMETETRDVPRLADITYPKEVVASRLVTEFETATSSFRCVSVNQKIEEKDLKRGPEYNTKSEIVWEREFSTPNFWLSRDSVTPLVNRATGDNVNGSYDSLITGPDNIANSALLFGANGGLNFSFGTISNHTLSWWINSIIADVDIWTFNNKSISLEYIDNMYYLVINNGSSVSNIPIEYQGEKWMFIAILFTTNTIRIVGNKQDFGVRNFSFGGYSGMAHFMNSVVGEAFDIRRTPRLISLDALNYYYDCVVRDNGMTGFLPNMR